VIYVAHEDDRDHHLALENRDGSGSTVVTDLRIPLCERLDVTASRNPPIDRDHVFNRAEWPIPPSLVGSVIRVRVGFYDVNHGQRGRSAELHRTPRFPDRAVGRRLPTDRVNFFTAAVSNVGAMKLLVLTTVACVTTAAMGCSSPRADERMSFFVTSEQAGDGGAIGGLAKADAHCEKLAEAVGSRKRSWRAYLSATAESVRPVNARDRIGRGPWFKARGLQVAVDINELHRSNALGAKTSLDEFGESPGYWHDMMTGSNPDGTLANGDLTCANWTSTHGHLLVGHSDKGGRLGGSRATSWNSAHSSGCTMLQSMGGRAYFYCFAAD
jgi:hypothetical protein